MTKTDAIEQIRAQLSLNDEPSSWTYEQRLKYNQTLAAYELANPGLFGNQDPAFLQRVIDDPGSPLLDDSFTSNLSAFGDEFVKQVEEKTTLGFTTLRNLIFAVAIIATVTFVIIKTKK